MKQKFIVNQDVITTVIVMIMELEVTILRHRNQKIVLNPRM